MRHDDRHIGEIHRDIVNWHRIAILQAHAAAARHAAADPAVSCMKDAREAGLRKYFVERIGDPVAGRKLLQGRMKFQAVNPARRHPTARLGDRLRATVRVEAAESKRNVGVALGEIRTLSLETTGLRDKVSSSEKTMQAILRDR